MPLPSAITVNDSGPGQITVTETGPSTVNVTLPVLNSAYDNVYDAGRYLLGDGTAEDTAWATMIAAVVAAGGGTIVFEAKTYRLDNAWVMTYSGTPPRQVPIIIQGAGCDATGGTGAAPTTGTIFDLRYDAAGANVAKWDLRGVGTFSVRDCNFIDGGTATNGTPFLKTTNTTLYVRNCYFRGKNSGTSANNDAIVLGGTTTSYGTSAASDAFQGYGTVIEGNYFALIRRLLYCRTFCNGVVFRDNTSWSNCGGVAAIELDGGDDSNTGNVFTGNLIEVTNYTYAVKLTDTAIVNTFYGNNYFDYDGSMTSYYYFGTASSYNTIVDGWHNDTGTWATGVDAATIATNTRITAHQSQVSRFAQPVLFAVTAAAPVYENLSNVRVDLFNTVNSAGDVFNAYTTYNSGTGFGDWFFNITPSGGSSQAMLQIRRISATASRIHMDGAGASRIWNQSGDFESMSGSGSTYWFGDPTSTSTKASMTGGVCSLPQLTCRSYRPTYGTTVTPDPTNGAHIRIEVTNGTAFTVAAPAVATAGQRIIIEVNNRSGGAMGVITWDSTYKMSGWVNPIDTYTRTIEFVYDSYRARWMQVGQVSPDLAP